MTVDHGSMPEYSLEEKARAFDALWEQCGKGRGVLVDYKYLPTDRKDTFRRVPRYSFEVVALGQSHCLCDVLHQLALGTGIKA